MSNSQYTQILEEFDQINKELSSEGISKKPQKIESLSKKLGHLSPIVENIKLLNKYETEKADTEKMLTTETDSDLLELTKDEIANLEKKIDDLITIIEESLKKTDPNDNRNSIIEIRAGTGGEEAALFAADLFRMYTRYAESQGWKVEIMNSHYTGNGGFKEVVFLVSGDMVYGKLKNESGVHRVQRIPVTESSGRIHTSTASVVILPEIDDVEVDVNPDDIKIDVYRSGGPGGQSVNTTDSAVRITHKPSGIVVTCQDEKSQLKNKARAMSILKSKLYEVEQEKQAQATSNIRNASIKGGDRSAKIRTYNFQESRVTDHRIKKTWHNLQTILNGELEEVIEETRKGLEINPKA